MNEPKSKIEITKMKISLKMKIFLSKWNETTNFLDKKCHFLYELYRSSCSIQQIVIIYLVILQIVILDFRSKRNFYE